MPEHEYSPKDAFELIMELIRSRDSKLAASIQDVIDFGIVEVEEHQPADRRKSVQTRSVRREFSDKEKVLYLIKAIERCTLDNALCAGRCNKVLGAVAAGTTLALEVAENPLLSYDDLVQQPPVGMLPPVEQTGLEFVNTNNAIVRGGELLAGGTDHLDDGLVVVDMLTDDSIRELREILSELQSLCTF